MRYVFGDRRLPGLILELTNQRLGIADSSECTLRRQLQGSGGTFPGANSVSTVKGPVLAALIAVIGLLVPAIQGQKVQFSLPKCTTLPTQIQMHGSAVVGDRLYVLGGNTPQTGGWSNKVYSANITPEAKLGSWRQERDMPEYRTYIGCSTQVINDRIYILAGAVVAGPNEAENNVEQSQTVMWTNVQSDGSLGEWRVSEPFPGDAVSCNATCCNGRNLFLVGGKAKQGPVDTILVADADDRGAPCNFRKAGKLPVALWFHGAALLDARMYVWGGLPTMQPKTVNARSFSAPVKADGSLGQWREESPLPTPTYSSAFCGFNDYLIGVGGRYVGANPTNEIWYTRLVNGKITAWSMLKTDIDARVYHALGLDASRGIVFISGGQQRTTTGAREGVPVRDTVQAFRLPQPADAQLEIAGGSSAAGTGTVDFSPLDKALITASQSAKQVLVYFYSPQVPACRRLWESVLKTPPFRELTGSTVVAAVNVADPQQSKFAARYSMFKVPSLMLVGPDGTRAKKLMELSSLDDVQAFLEGR